MTDTPQDTALKVALDKVVWPHPYCVVTVTVKDGKRALVKVERTLKD